MSTLVTPATQPVASQATVNQAVAEPARRNGLDEVEGYVNSMLHSFGERIVSGRAGEVESSRIVRHAQSGLFSSRNLLPKHVIDAADNVIANPLSAFLKAAYDYAVSSTTAITGVIYTALQHIFPSIAENNKKLQLVELKFILQTLKHLGYVPPQTEIALHKAFKEDNFAEIERTALSLGLVEDPIDNTRILKLLMAKQFISAFRYLHTLALLHELNSRPAEWEDLITDQENIEFANSVKALRENSSTDGLNQLLVSITTRVATKKWLERELQHPSLKDNTETQALEIKALAAIRDKNEKGFAEVCLELFALSDKTKRTPLEQCYIEEVITHFKLQGADLFKTIALQFGQEKFVASWGQKAEALLQLLKIQALEITDASHLEKLNAITQACLKAYGHYGSLLESEERGPLSRTQYASQYGKTVQIWRAINEEIVRHTPAAHRSPESVHSVCSCLFGRHAHTKIPAAKWKGLPEKLATMGALNQIPQDSTRAHAKSVLFMTCTYGNGHMSATDALINYTKQSDDPDEFRYHFRSLNVPLDVLLPLDPIFNALGKIWNHLSIDYVYNTFMSWDRCDLIALMRKIGAGKPTEEAKNQSKALIREAILKERPDLVVMTYSLNAVPIFEVCKELGIPVTAISTDTDISGFEDMTLPKHFKLTTYSKHRKTMDTLHLDEEFVRDHLVETGPPVRPEFLKEYTAESIRAIRRQRGIADDEQVVFFSSGGLGVWSEVPGMLASWNDPDRKVRVIVVCGRNTTFKEHLERNVLPHIANKVRVKIDVLGLTSAQDMSDLMHIAHVVIGKPGGITTAEVIHCGSRLAGPRFLGDQTGFRLDWERLNNDIAIDIGIGDKVETMEQLIPKLQAQLNLPKVRNTLFQTEAPYSKKFTELFSGMIRTAESDPELLAQRAEWEPREALQAHVQQARRSQAILV